MSWVLAATGLLLVGEGEAAVRPGKTPWLDDLALAQDQSRRSGRLIFAVLH